MKVIRLGRGEFKPKRSLARSEAEEAFALAWGGRLPAFQREWRFHPTRKWRFDFAWPEYKIALECQGLGRHQRFKGYQGDCEKQSAAATLGWKVLWVMSCDMRNVKFWVDMVQDAIANAETR
jgi:very-short-patch-repair endonuclease